MDSLDEKYYNKYCKEFLFLVKEKSSKSPEIHCIGENCDAPISCSCDTPSHYILTFETNIVDNYPVLCGDCFYSVPLYKLPKTYHDEEYYDIHWWKRLYTACDSQFVGGIGERHGYKMMNSPDSQLSKEGMRICAFWEAKVHKPFYYFLFKYYRHNKPTCPQCNENWVNNNEDIKYDYACEKCRLVSND